jgi:3-oxoacyl-[acyl-carrier protein] reductase
MKVLITGATGGIGSAVMHLFMQNGHSVYAPTRSELDLIKPINLQNPEYDIIVNCAGINPIKSLDDVTDNNVMRVNYLAPLEIIQQCIPYMVNNKYGRIINIGSIWIDTAKKGRMAYSVSKNALHALTKSITAEYGHYNILANTVSPGFIETNLTYQNNSAEDILKILHNIPVSRLGKPEEIAKLVYYLSIENTYIAGQNIIIDGGFSCTTY